MKTTFRAATDSDPPAPPASVADDGFTGQEPEKNGFSLSPHRLAEYPTRNDGKAGRRTPCLFRPSARPSILLYKRFTYPALTINKLGSGKKLGWSIRRDLRIESATVTAKCAGVEFIYLRTRSGCPNFERRHLHQAWIICAPTGIHLAREYIEENRQ